MNSAPSLNPEVLILARDSRGCTQQELAEAAGVTQGMISKAQRGVATLSPAHISAIAEYLGYPERLFYEPGRMREVGSTCLYHRKRKTLPAKVLSRLNATMHIRNINIVNLLDGLEIEGDRVFHTLDPDEYGDATAVARELRRVWRVPDGPIPNLTALIESAGGIVLMEDFGHRKLFGMSCWTHGGGHPLFYLNSAASTDELRWTMAHELGHLIMHGTPTSGDPEEEADAFAGEFLAPATLFRPDVRRLTFDRLPQLKAYWGLSMKGVITRALAIGAINRPAAIKLYKQHSARGYNAAEPYPVKPEPPTLVETAIHVHLQEHGYSRDELAEAVRLNPDEFRRDFLHEPEPSQGNVVNLLDRRRAGLSTA